MTDDNHVETPGTEDEIPGIPVPGDEVNGTPVPDDEISGSPVDDSVEVPRKVKRSAVRGGSTRWPMYLGIGCLMTCCLCCFLPLCLLAATGAGLAAILSNSESTDTQTQQFTIDQAQPLTLSVDGSSGSINIRRGSSDDEVSVTYTKKAYGWTKSAAEKELERINVDIQQPADRENEITISTDTERREDSFWFLANQVDMTITIPEEAEITVNNNTGSITVADVQVGALDLQSNTGSITFEGSLSPDATSPLKIQTNTGSISVILPSDTAARLDARADTGSVSVATFDQMADVSESQSGAGKTWTGTLGDSTSNPPTLRLHTTTGSISVLAR